MEILHESRKTIAHAMEVLGGEGVVVHATETCYGLACDLSNADAVRRLFAIKNRPEHQPVSALFSSVEMAKEYVFWNERAEELAHAFLPGPLTLILPLRADAHFGLFACPLGGGTIGVRISSHPLAQTLVATFGRPISTTSANIHGEPNPFSVTMMTTQFEGREFCPDLIIDSGMLPEVKTSKVIDLTGADENILRE